MPVLAVVLTTSWGELCAAARSSSQVTRSGLPTKTTREGILAELVSIQRRILLGGLEATNLSDGEAQLLRQEIAAARDRLCAYAIWIELLKAAPGGRLLPLEDRATDARDLSRIHPAPDTMADASQLAAETVAARASQRRERVFTAEALNDVLADPELRLRLETRLGSVWRDSLLATGDPADDSSPASRPPVSGRSRADRTDRFLTMCGFEDGLAMAPPEAEHLWAQISVAPFTPSPSFDASTGLSRDVATQPDLTGALFELDDEDTDRAWYPRDASIHERLYRVARGTDAAPYPPELTAERAFEVAIDASVDAGGVPLLWARWMLAAGGTALGLMSWTDQRDETTMLAGLTGGQRMLALNWRRSVEKAILRGGTTALRPTARAFYENPASYFTGRLWTRVMRRALISEEPPNAVDVWAHIYGAFTSTRGHLKLVAGKGAAQEGIEGEVLRLGGRARKGARAAEPFRTGVDDVLASASEREGSAPVVEFWNAVATLWLREPDPPDRVAQWKRWVTAEGRTLDDLPFRHVRAWLWNRGELPTPGGIGQDGELRQDEDTPPGSDGEMDGTS